MKTPTENVSGQAIPDNQFVLDDWKNVPWIARRRKKSRIFDWILRIPLLAAVVLIAVFLLNGRRFQHADINALHNVLTNLRSMYETAQNITDIAGEHGSRAISSFPNAFNRVINHVCELSESIITMGEKLLNRIAVAMGNVAAAGADIAGNLHSIAISVTEGWNRICANLRQPAETVPRFFQSFLK